MLRLVVREGMIAGVIGIAAGSVAALVAALSLERLVFGVSASDPLTLAAVAATLGLSRSWPAWSPPTAPRAWIPPPCSATERAGRRSLSPEDGRPRGNQAIIAL